MKNKLKTFLKDTLLQHERAYPASEKMVKDKQKGKLQGLPFYLGLIDVLSFDSCYARESLALDSLKQSATTGRDVANLVSKTELVDASYRVATTDE